MGNERVPGHDDVVYRLISYDANGDERAEDGALASEEAVSDLAGCTDVILLSHGWQADVSAARMQYGQWIATMLDRDDRLASLRARKEDSRVKVIGMHWPSKAWGDEDLDDGGFPASPVATSSGEPRGAGAASFKEEVVAGFAEKLEDTAEVRDKVRTLLEIALVEPAPRRLPAGAIEAYQELDRLLRGAAEGNGAAPGDDREPFDAEAMYQACRLAQVSSFGLPSLGGMLAPLRTLTFWNMKKRANRFGEKGAASLLDDIQQQHSELAVHLMGHSFGCIVAASAVAGPPERPRSKAVASMTLMQGAMSLWSFCSDIPMDPGRAGYFQRVVEDKLVLGPILASTSYHDRAVRTFYAIAATMAKQVEFPAGSLELPKYGGIGMWGIQGIGPRARAEALQNSGSDLRLKAGDVVNLDATSVIANGSGPSGAHSDITHPAVADAVWQAIICGSQIRS
jgi:pimeloyl-ACP methyl ester carboxylesterase